MKELTNKQTYLLVSICIDVHTSTFLCKGSLGGPSQKAAVAACFRSEIATTSQSHKQAPVVDLNPA